MPPYHGTIRNSTREHQHFRDEHGSIIFFISLECTRVFLRSIKCEDARKKNKLLIYEPTVISHLMRHWVWHFVASSAVFTMLWKIKAHNNLSWIPFRKMFSNPTEILRIIFERDKLKIKTKVVGNCYDYGTDNEHINLYLF